VPFDTANSLSWKPAIFTRTLPMIAICIRCMLYSYLLLQMQQRDTASPRSVAFALIARYCTIVTEPRFQRQLSAATASTQASKGNEDATVPTELNRIS
jgi:hypothetical protein